MQFFQISAQLATKPDPFIDGSDARARAATALQIDPKGLVKPKEQVDAEMQQQQRMATAQAALPNVINKVGDIARDQQAQTAK
jgi:hypothetical protein